jgi:hypothetical protein
MITIAGCAVDIAEAVEMLAGPVAEAMPMIAARIPPDLAAELGRPGAARDEEVQTLRGSFAGDVATPTSGAATTPDVSPSGVSVRGRDKSGIPASPLHPRRTPLEDHLIEAWPAAGPAPRAVLKRDEFSRHWETSHGGGRS